MVLGRYPNGRYSDPKVCFVACTDSRAKIEGLIFNGFWGGSDTQPAGGQVLSTSNRSL